MAFRLKSLPQILQAMRSTVLANSPLNDINPASALLTFLEAAATEDFKQYYQMLNIINNYSLDRTVGEDLDNRAVELGLTEGRLPATRSFGQVTIGDSAITKISTKVYAGLNGPIEGQSFIYVNDASDFPGSGSIIVGRGTANVEIVPYTSITFGTNFDTINLSSALTNDHGTDETIILSQGGDRIIAAGSIVRVPPADFSDSILFTVNFESTILDGEEEVQGVLVTATVEGTSGNVPAGQIREFDSPPFPTATVNNPLAFTNGTDRESDAKLRDRIKAHIQSLSRGTANSIVNGVVGISDPDENKRVVSANYIDTTSPDGIGRLIIDDGTGFEPSFTGQGFEVLVRSATGGEQFLQAELFPMVKALLQTINREPFAILNNMTLEYQVSNDSETITFTDADFRIPGVATAQEVTAAINNKATLIEARTTDEGRKIEIRAKAQINEDIRVTGGTANDTSILNFPTNRVDTIQLYKFDGQNIIPLNKDGRTAFLENSSAEPFNFSIAPTFLDVQLDNETMWSGTARIGSGLSTLVDPKLGQKFTGLNVFETKKVTFLSGANEGQTANILSYNGFDTLTISGGLTVADSDEYKIEDIERIYFSHIAQVDFDSPQSVTAEDIVRVINAQIKGLATLSSSDTKVTLTSKLEAKADSAVKIWGGTANSILNFPTTQVNGAEKDFIFNRFNGQVELIEPLKEGESVTAGTRATRAFLIGRLPQPFTLANGDTITFKVDRGNDQIVTFQSADFSNILQASAAEVVAVINRDTTGMVASVTDDNRITVRTNTFDLEGGAIEVVTAIGTGRNLGFDFIEKTNLLSHTAFLVADSNGDYDFVEEDRLVVILDNDIVTKTFDIRMDLNGTVLNEVTVNQGFTANITSISQNFTNKFEDPASLPNFKIIWKTGANAGEQRTIAAYLATTTGEIQMNSPLPNPIGSGDTFVIIPVTLENVITHLSNTANTTLSLDAEISAVEDGTRIQIAARTDGSAGFVNVTGSTANEMLNEIVLDGTADSVFVDNALYKPGMKVSLQGEGAFSTNEIRVTNEETGVTTDPVNVNVGGAFAIDVEQQGSGQVQIADVRLRGDTSDDLDGRSWFLNSANDVKRYYVWYNTPTNAPVDPNVIGRDGIRVNIATDASANDVAIATAAAIDALDDFSCPAPVGDTITITNADIGAAAPPVDLDVFGAFDANIVQLGIQALPEIFKITLPLGSDITESQYFLFQSANDATEYYAWYNKNEGLQEIVQITLPADNADSLNGTHFLLNAASDKKEYYIWFLTENGDAVADDPNISGKIGVRVDILTDDTANAVANAVAAKIDTLTEDFNATPPSGSGAVVTVANLGRGATTTATDGDVGVGFAVNVVQEGTLGDPLQFTPALVGKTGVEIVITDSDDATLVGSRTGIALNAIVDFSATTTIRETEVISVTEDDPEAGVFRVEVADDAQDYLVSDNATIKRLLVLNFSNVPQQGRDGYKYFTGLLRRVQRTVDGLDASTAFPGIKAAGVQIEVTAPTVQRLFFEIDVSLIEGLNINIVVDDLKNAVSSYVNGLDVGEDVILTEIIERIMGIDGITDVEIIFPTANIPIADNEIARANLGDITIG